MRTGPGKHLKGLTLMGGVITPEEVRVDNILSFPRADAGLLLV